MKVYDAQSLRNVALVGHSGAGKTQLLSALLFDAGAVNRLGRVDDGTTVTDYDEEEIARKHTLSASLAYVEWNRTKINFIDTPGMANFLSDARAALRVSDAALVVVDAVSGVQVSTEKVWSMAAEMETPRLVVLNRLDRERASLGRALDSLRGVFGRTVIPIQIPIGEEKDFRGVVDLVAMKGWTFAADGSGKPSEGADSRRPRSSGASRARRAHRDGRRSRRCADGEVLRVRHADAGRAGRRPRSAPSPPAASSRSSARSATANIGMQPLLDAILTYVPSPAERPFAATAKGSDDGVAVKAADRRPPPYSCGRRSPIRSPDASRCSASSPARSRRTRRCRTSRATSSERFGHLTLLQGKTPTNVAEVRAGDLAAVAKLKDTLTSDLLGDKASRRSASLPIKFPEPVISYAIEPKSRGDEEKISTALHRLQEEDPSISYNRDAQTKQLLLAGQGQSHIEVTVAKLKRRFGVEVNLKIPRIPYRETITASTEAHGRHKKQTGGHGQFGDCKVRFDPLPRGSDFEFVDDIFGGSIPRQFVPAVEKGLQDARLRGFLAGYPMVDFRATVFDGSYHAGRLERAVVQDGGVARLQGRNVTRAADAARAGHGRRGLRAERLRRRSDGGSEQPPGPHRRHGHARRVDRHPRQGADGRDADLRAAPHVSHRRTRLLPHGVLALRRGAVAPARQDHHGREGGAGAGGGGRGDV